MPVKLNRVGYSHARELIEAGRVDRTSPWDWTTEDENRLLGDPPDWAAYRRWFLGRDADADPETKAAWKYPCGKGGRVYLSALRAIRTRAAQNNATEVFEAAGRLLDLAKGEQGRSLRIAARGGSYELFLYGEVGGEIAARELLDEIAAVPGELVVRINSYGGDVADGLALYNALRRRGGVTVVVDGVAASAASLIAMAGDRIEMADNATLMVHGPWTATMGDARAMRDTADALERLAEAMARIYASRPRVGYEQALEWVTDGRDHWFSAQEALELGLVDAVVEPRRDAAKYLKRAKEWMEMARKHDAPADEPRKQDAPAAKVDPPAQDPPRQADRRPEDVVDLGLLKARAERIRTVARPFAHREDVRALLEDALADPTVPVESFQEQLLALLAKDARPIGAPGGPQATGAGSVQVLDDESAKLRKGVVAWLAVKAGVERYVEAAGVPKAELDPGEFRGMSLVDIARDLLERAGVRTRGMSRTEVVTRALATKRVFASMAQSTSDFAVLLEDAMHKTLLGAYRTQPVTWPRWARRGTVADFRPHGRYRTGMFGRLEKLVENGLIPYQAVPDGEKATITADEYGVRVGLPRKAIVNDDLGAFRDLASQLGAAARRSEEADAIALLVSNPTMPDGVPLFDAAHANVGTAATPSVVAFDEARTLMASQKDPAGNDFLDLRPAVWLGPIGLLGDAQTVNDAQYDPDAPNKLQKPNKVRGLFSDLVGTPRLSGTAWYALADPAIAPVIEIAFLEGESEPKVEQTSPWETTGLEWRVTHAYGVAAIDYRGAVYNAGA